MNTYSSISLKAFAIVLLIFSSCTRNFEEIDQPKTGQVTTVPDGLFTVVTQRGSQTWLMWDRSQRLMANLYMQYNFVHGGISTEYYEPSFGIFSSIWDRSYGDQSFEFAPLFYATEVVKVAEEQDLISKSAIARIWRAYLFQRMTDMYGDIPYFNAFEVLRPSFDRQEDIYRDLFNELLESRDLLEDELSKPNSQRSPTYGSADLIYQGDRLKWVKFANAMMLRMALRVQKVDPSFTNEIISEVEGAQFMSSNEDSNKMIWDGAVSNIYFRNPILVTEVFDNTKMSETMVNFLIDNNDPRLPLYCRPAISDGEYRGFKNGLLPEDLSILDDEDYQAYSRIGNVFIEPDGATYNFHYAEQCFLLAEAAWRNLLPNEDAESWYNEGIRAAMNMYGFTDEQAITDYISQAQIQYDEANALELIMTQKWVALCMNGLEAWFEKRRTGLPVLQALEFTGPLNGGVFPRRLIYSDRERLLNETELLKAVDRMGGDTQLIRVWWDVE